MSVDYYRRQIDTLRRELADLEAKAATERERAARERSAGLRAVQSITKSTSASTAQSRQREAQRKEEAALRFDRAASRIAGQAASKQRALSNAQRSLANAESSVARRMARRSSVIEFEVDQDPVGIRSEPDAPAPLAPVEIVRLGEMGVVDAALETAKATALGALSLVPFIGPVLREIVGVSWGDLRAERLERFAVQLGMDVSQLQERLDIDFVKRSEFEALAEQAMERVVLRRNESKIRRFSAAVANSATIDRPVEKLRERYLDWLDELRPGQLAALAQIAAGDAGWVRPNDVFSPGQVVQSKLAHVLQGLDIDVFDIRAIEQRGLVGSVENTTVLLAAADDISRLVTPAGRAFLNFVAVHGDAASQAEPATASDS